MLPIRAADSIGIASVRFTLMLDLRMRQTGRQQRPRARMRVSTPDFRAGDASKNRKGTWSGRMKVDTRTAAKAEAAAFVTRQGSASRRRSKSAFAHLSSAEEAPNATAWQARRSQLRTDRTLRPYVSFRGSSASLRPSPTKLKLVTASVIARPGTMASHGALVRYVCALSSMFPQLGVGGWMPNPRNEM